MGVHSAEDTVRILEMPTAYLENLRMAPRMAQLSVPPAGWGALPQRTLALMSRFTGGASCAVWVAALAQHVQSSPRAPLGLQFGPYDQSDRFYDVPSAIVEIESGASSSSQLHRLLQEGGGASSLYSMDIVGHGTAEELGDAADKVASLSRLEHPTLRFTPRGRPFDDEQQLANETYAIRFVGALLASSTNSLRSLVVQPLLEPNKLLLGCDVSRLHRLEVDDVPADQSTSLCQLLTQQLPFAMWCCTGLCGPRLTG